MIQISSGSYSENQNLSRTKNIDIVWSRKNWKDEITVINGSPPSVFSWNTYGYGNECSGVCDGLTGAKISATDRIEIKKNHCSLLVKLFFK